MGRAFQDGIDAGKLKSLKNPMYKTLDERLAFRHGWMRGMKEQNAKR
jgi:ribosome modulation factor